jgi:hypothetical protein
MSELEENPTYIAFCAAGRAMRMAESDLDDAREDPGENDIAELRRILKTETENAKQAFARVTMPLNVIRAHGKIVVRTFNRQDAQRFMDAIDACVCCADVKVRFGADWHVESAKDVPVTQSQMLAMGNFGAQLDAMTAFTESVTSVVVCKCETPYVKKQE